MSLMVDITADQPPLPGRLAVRDLALEEGASLAEELLAYHQHFAPLFYRREQREWAEIYLRGLLTVESQLPFASNGDYSGRKRLPGKNQKS